MRRWKRTAPCDNCPFSTSDAGRHLARSLGRTRTDGIKRVLLRGEHFLCHKTTTETGNGSNLLCAGALAWQHQRGVTSQYEQVCERLSMLASLQSHSPTGDHTMTRAGKAAAPTVLVQQLAAPVVSFNAKLERTSRGLNYECTVLGATTPEQAATLLAELRTRVEAVADAHDDTKDDGDLTGALAASLERGGAV